MSLSDYVPDRLQRGHWRYVFVAFVVVFLLDEPILIALALGGVTAAVAVLVVLVVAVVVLTQTQWGRRRWKRLRRRI